MVDSTANPPPDPDSRPDEAPPAGQTPYREPRSDEPPASASDASTWIGPGVGGAVEMPPPVAPGTQMKRRNPLAVWIGLPLITLGIYHFVWYYKIHREMGDFDRRRPIATIGPVLVLIFLSWTVIAPLISYYRTGNRIVDSQRAAGLPETCVPIVGVLLMLVLGLGTLYYQVELNKVVDRYGGTATPPGTNVPLYA
jgi:Domain of unknown function (DUF4234)